jgi:phage-related protein
MDWAGVLDRSVSKMVQSGRSKTSKRLQVVFYKTSSGSEPVRDWLRSLPVDAKRIIGEDIKTVQYGYPLGMPLVRKVEPDLFEVRSHLSRQIARVLFTVDDDVMILLHGFIKKTQKSPLDDLRLARARLTQLRGER